MILETIHSPADVKALNDQQIPSLCQELRRLFGGAASPGPEDTWPLIWGRWS